MSTSTFVLIAIMLVALSMIAARRWSRGARFPTRKRQRLRIKLIYGSGKIGGPFTLVGHRGDRVTDATYRGVSFCLFRL